MKKLQLFALLMLVMTAFSASAALNETESALVGSWKCVQNDTMDSGDDLKIIMSGYDAIVLNNDKTGSLDGAIRLEMPINIQNIYTNSFYVDVTLNGPMTWSVDGNVLNQKASDLKINCSDIHVAKDDDQAKQLVPQLKQLFDQLVPMMTKELQDGKKEAIVKISADELQLQEVGEANADIEVYKRVK